MRSQLPFWRVRYEKAGQDDHHSRLLLCLSAIRRAEYEGELMQAFWWVNTAAMHVQALQAQQNPVTGKKTGGRRP